MLGFTIADIRLTIHKGKTTPDRSNAKELVIPLQERGPILPVPWCGFAFN